MAHKGYTLNYLIDYFSSIPNHRWTTGELQNGETVQMCALGHAIAGLNPSTAVRERLNDGEFDVNARAEALQEFLGGNVENINDANGANYLRLGATPRGRIIRALRNRKRTGNIFGTES